MWTVKGRRVMRACALVLLASVVSVALLLLHDPEEPVLAAHHIAEISEVMSGFAGDSDVQFVEVDQLASYQSFVTNTRLTAFNPDGSLAGVLLDPVGGDVSLTGDKWIMGTAAFETASGINADFVFSPGILPAAGMVCWGAPDVSAPLPNTWAASDPANYVDCVSYGGAAFTGTNPMSPNPAGSGAGDGTLSLTRSTSSTGKITNPWRNSDDDLDFKLAVPSPTNDAGQVGSLDPSPNTPTPTPTVTPTVPSGGPEMRLSIVSGGFCELLAPSNCHVRLGDQFIVSVDAAVVPASGYVHTQGWISYGDDLGDQTASGTIKDASTVWPDCDPNAYLAFTTDESGNANEDSYFAGCVTDLIEPQNNLSFYHGSLFTITLTCTNSFSVNVIDLIAYDVLPAGISGTRYVDDEFNTVVPKVAPITVTCQHIKKQAGSSDTDGDGCTDAQESGIDETLGGLRRYDVPWDYYDVNADQIIDLTNDVLGVIQHYAPTGNEPEYEVTFDRGPSTGPNPWNMTAPDGVIDLTNDILGVIKQYQHNC